MAIASKNAGFSTTIASYSDFTLSLFKAITVQSPDKNVIVAPVSVAITLAMVCNGAQGTTRAAILDMLGLNSLSMEALNQANALLLTTLQQVDPQLKLTIQNRLDIGGPLHPAFQQVCQTHYQANIDQNASPGTLELKNEIDFKGPWTDPFDPEMTTTGLFNLQDGAQKHCHMMMSKHKSWAYAAHDQFEMARLPYGQKRVSFYIVLPAKNVPLSAILNDLTPANWRNWTAELQAVEGKIELPRFELDYELVLNDMLSSMGMTEAFDRIRANFREMSPMGASIDQVLHRAKIRVDEEGSEVSAITMLTMVFGIMPPPRSFHLKADRPFLYVIQEDSARVPLFMGILADPAPLDPVFKEDQFDLKLLAEALELIAAEIEAGHGFNAGLGKIYEVYNHEVSLSIGRAIQEMQLGKAWRDALESLRDRLKIPDLTLYLDDVIQANERGESLLDVTRTHAQRIRTTLLPPPR